MCPLLNIVTAPTPVFLALSTAISIALLPTVIPNALSASTVAADGVSDITVSSPNGFRTSF